MSDQVNIVRNGSVYNFNGRAHCARCGKMLDSVSFRCVSCGQEPLCEQHRADDRNVCDICQSLPAMEVDGFPDLVRIPTGGDVKEPYWMGKYPVTRREYKAFLHAQGEDHNLPLKNDHLMPINQISYADALDYCDWLTQAYLRGTDLQFTLPTKRQWVWAAIGDNQDYLYPWGKRAPNSNKCHFASNKIRDVTKSTHSKSVYGCYDMVGNVAEFLLAPKHETRECYVIGGNFGTHRVTHLTVKSTFDVRQDQKNRAYGFRIAKVLQRR